MSLEPLDGLTVLDLYAGSGALGIEALSRGAREAHFVEHDRSALTALRLNLDQLGLGERGRVWPLELPRALGRLSEVLARADLIFADPPYGGSDARALLEALGAKALGASVRVVLEHHGKDEIPERAGALARVRERRYGETAVSIYRIGGAPAEADHREEPA